MGHQAPGYRALGTHQRGGATVADDAVGTDGTVAWLQAGAAGRRDGLGSAHREPLSSRSHATLRASSTSPLPDRPRAEASSACEGPTPLGGYHSQDAGTAARAA